VKVNGGRPYFYLKAGGRAKEITRNFAITLEYPVMDDEWSKEAAHWRVTLKCGNRSMVPGLQQGGGPSGMAQHSERFPGGWRMESAETMDRSRQARTISLEPIQV
jgi:hypothetical protein